jgi:hypothetical protein
MTPRIKKAFQIYSKKMKSGEPFTMAEVLVEAGYSEGTAVTPSQVTDSVSWRKLMNRYPDEPIMDVIYKDAMGTGREANENRKLFLKAKGRLKDSISLDINKDRAHLFEDEEV